MIDKHVKAKIIILMLRYGISLNSLETFMAFHCKDEQLHQLFSVEDEALTEADYNYARCRG